MKLTEVYQDALKRKYALGAFNFYNMESMKSILDGAQRANAPVIIAVSESAMDYFGFEFLKNAILSARKAYSVPFFVHLDHGKSYEACKKAIECGFDSVMIDGSALPFDENVNITKKVVTLAHKKGIQVEAELGRLKGIEDDVHSDETLFTDPNEAKIFVDKTKCDSLAVAIGTSHGVNKFAKKAELRLDVLSQIEKLIPNTPLVLHGASSIPSELTKEINSYGAKLKNAKGVPEDILNVVSTKHHICKINVDSDLRIATTLAVRKYLKEKPEEIDARKYLKSAMNKCSDLVYHRIKNVFMTKKINNK